MATSVQEFNKQNPNYIGNVGRYVQPWERKRPEEEKKSKKGSGNQSWLSSIISELAGAGGATGGAAAGAAIGTGILPGLGTLIGAIGGGFAGGFAGGTGGRLVENQVRDKEMRLGDALKEGGVSGLFGAGGAAFQGLRGAQALGKAGGGGIRAGVKGLSGLSDDAAKAVVLGGKKSGSAIGKAIYGIDDAANAAGGALRQSTIAPTSSLGRASDQGKLIRVAQKSPELRGSGFKKFKNVESVIAKKSNEVDELLKGVKKTVGADDFSRQVDDLRNAIPDPAEQKRFATEFNTIINNTFGKKPPTKLTATDVSKLRKGVNKQLTAVFKKIEKGTQLTDKDEALLKIRDVFTNSLDDLAPKNLRPKVHELNGEISTLIDGIPEFKKLAETPLQIFGTRIPGASSAIPRAYQSGMDMAGRTASRIGSVPAPLADVIAGTAARGALMPDFNSAQPGEEQMPPQLTMQNGGIYDQSGGLVSMNNPQSSQLAGLSGGQEMQGMGAPQANNQFSPQNIQMQVQNILASGGDLDDVKKYLSIVEVMKELGGGAGGQPELTANQRNKMIQLQSVGQELSTLRNEVVQSGLFNSDSQLSASLGGFYDSTIGRLTDQQKKIYQDQLKTRGIQLVRALGEVGNLSEAEQEAAIKNLPAPGDTFEGAMQKLQQLEDRFNNLALIVQQGGGGQDALADILAAQQYAPY